MRLLLFVVSLCGIATLSWATCDVNQFQCANGRCINLNWRCDRDDDCHDNSDETDCQMSTCADSFFRCDNERCIPERWVCDDSDDCKDNSDERKEMCANQTCDGYRCKSNGQCIPADWKCDGQPDCPDGEDEASCETVCDPESEFQCADKKCISVRWKCDNHNDCDDGSDEKNCPTDSCDPDSEKMCDDGECINDYWWCDGDIDCKDSSDEARCANETLNTKTCSPTEFRCHLPNIDPQCIHLSWHCDGEKDCTDGSDEIGCEDQTCASDERKCDDTYCIKEEFFCDGEVDCMDGLDEKNCTYPEPPKCPAGEFNCGNGKCISDRLLCNTEDDCGNFADEQPDNCPDQNTCTENNGGCSDICVPDAKSSKGRRCECRSGFKLMENSETECEDINECEIHGTCSQICVNIKGSYKCGCMTNYTLTDHRYCKASSGQRPELILSDKHELRRYHLDTFHYSRLLENDVTGAVAMDFDYHNKKIYWTDVQAEKVYSANLDGSHFSAVMQNNLGMTDGLAVDWVHGNLYLSDTEFDRIEVARLNGSFRKTLVNSDIDEPRALAVDPYKGWIYWTDWGNKPKIEKCGMNGEMRSAIVTKDIMWPNGITIDYTQQRLYWVDAKLHTISSARLDGSDQRRVLHSHHNLGHPFDITVFEDYLYWTDWMTNAVHRVSKFGRDNVTTLVLDLKTPMGIHVLHEFRQPIAIRHCGENNGGCSHLCLPKPVMDTDVKPGSVCACPDGMKLQGRLSCVEDDSEITTPEKPPKTETDDSKDNRLPVTPKPDNHTQEETTETKTDTTEAPNAATDSSSEKTSGHGIPEETEEVKGPGHVAIIAILVIAIVGGIVAVVAFFVIRGYKRRNVKSMNFDNPVYRKTTTDERLIMGKSDTGNELTAPLNDDGNQIV